MISKVFFPSLRIKMMEIPEKKCGNGKEEDALINLARILW